MMKTKLEKDIHNGLSPIGIVKLVMIILFFLLTKSPNPRQNVCYNTKLYTRQILN